MIDVPQIGIPQMIKLLPENYAQLILESGAIRRWRGIKTPEELMLLCLFHLVNGSTLVETSRIAKDAHIAEISDVAFMDRFALCAEWFKSICEELSPSLLANYAKPAYLDKYRVIALDASNVTEKG
ncbi:MAG: IS4/IS5 family transposase, partial [Oscillospiraceae bacterium]|nr:IS4/IS5 family transposase [Oscillospiraceae bacterium]